MLSRCHAGPTPAKMRFSCDSPLEQAGFELSVPPQTRARRPWLESIDQRRSARLTIKGDRIWSSLPA